MYKKHSEFDAPADARAKIWRYLDFTKFVWMLEESALWFARGDQFDDPFEGSRPKQNIAERFSRFCELHGKHPNKLTNQERQGFEQELREDGQRDREFVAVNCWHLNEHESAAMWRLYLKSNEGIAIQSTFQRLVEALSATDSTGSGCHGVHVGLVKYIDYERDTFGEKSSFTRFLHKRKSFEHEREIRAITRVGMQMQSGDCFDYTRRRPLIGGGVPIRVALHDLIEAVYIAPGAGWMETLVRKVLQRYGVRVWVRRTNLEDQPLF